MYGSTVLLGCGPRLMLNPIPVPQEIMTRITLLISGTYYMPGLVPSAFTCGETAERG